MTTRSPGEHRDPLAGTGTPLPPDRRPEPGPIAILPRHQPVFAAEIEAAGGVVAPLSPTTRGILWVAGGRPTAGGEGDELETILHEHPAIGWVQLPWSGVDGFASVLSQFAAETTPIWTSAKGAYAEPVAEHALALALGLLRDLPEKSRATSWAVHRIGISLYGRNVLIIGAGGIAVELIRLLAPFETSITIVRRAGGHLAGADRTVLVDRLSDVLPDADVVIVAAAATGSTIGLIGAREIAAMKPSAVLVNIARGSLVDSGALAAALNSGHLAGAALDVTAPEPLPDGHPLWTAPRCVITSHSADTLEMVEPLLAERLRENVVAFLGDGAFIGIVDPAAGY